MTLKDIDLGDSYSEFSMEFILLSSRNEKSVSCRVDLKTKPDDRYLTGCSGGYSYKVAKETCTYQSSKLK